jgi:hypothetical protein
VTALAGAWASFSEAYLRDVCEGEELAAARTARSKQPATGRAAALSVRRAPDALADDDQRRADVRFDRDFGGDAW